MYIKYRHTLHLFFYFVYTLSLGQTSLFAYEKNVIKFENNSKMNVIFNMVSDHNGVMWLGTASGLARYDGYETIFYKADTKDPDSLSTNLVYNINQDRDNTLWICTTNGLNHFDPQTGIFTKYFHDDKKHSDQLWASAIEGDKIWIASNNSLECFDKKTKKFIVYNYKKDDGTNYIFTTIFIDSQKNIWCGGEAVFTKFDRETGTFKNYTKETKTGDFPTKEVIQIYEDSDNNFWITDFGLGLFKMNRKNETFKLFSNIPGDSTSISSNNAYCLLEDLYGNFWVGTDGGGLNKFDRKTETFSHYQHSIYDTDSLSNDIVLSLAQDISGNIYVGTYGNGIDIYKQGNFFNYKNKPEDKNSLIDNDVNSVVEDRQGNIWMITESGGLNKFDRKTEEFTLYDNFNGTPLDSGTSLVIDKEGIMWIGTWYHSVIKFDIENNTMKQIDGPSINSLYLDSQDNVWISTDRGLMRINKKENKLEKFDEIDIPELEGISLSGIIEDSHGYLWLNMLDRGAVRLDLKNSSYKLYNLEKYGKEGFLDNDLNKIYEDRNKDIWLLSQSGMVKIDRKNEKLTQLTTNEGFPANTVKRMTEDTSGNYWITTDIGIIKYNPNLKSSEIFNSKSGLLTDSFVGLLTLSNNEIIATSRKGITIFNPNDVKIDPHKPKLLISISKTNKYNFLENNSTLHLSYKENELNFEMFLMDFKDPAKTKYKYMLEGYDSNWLTTESIREVYYKKLKGGTYKLKVKGQNSDGVWSDEVIINLNVETAPWLTWWAFILYAVVTLLLLFIITRVYIEFKTKKQDKELRKQKEITERLQTLDKLKDEFLANTSHELKTPINGIIGIAESLYDGVAGKLPDVAEQNLSLIVNSGKRLANLINDILDFSKLKNKDIVLSIKQVDINQIAELIIAMTKPLLATKDVELINKIPRDIQLIQADEDRLQQIIFNLVGNAVKFTEVGSIEINSRIKDAMIEVSVTDTGLGIPEDKFPTIFSSFEQVDKSTAREFGGTGLGLSITKQIVELHKGKIWLESEVGKGSIFTFSLPLNHEGTIVEEKINIITSEIEKSYSENVVDGLIIPELGENSKQHLEKSETHEVSSTALSTDIDNSSYQPRLLIVDDELINLQVLINQFSLKNYSVTTATNGRDALQLIESGLKFDLILLDIMMPKMSGFEVCETLRKQYSVFDLPVLMLTAKNQPKDVITGLTAGANDYVFKPFSKEELLARTKTLLDLKQAVNRAMDSNKKLNTEKNQRKIAENLISISNTLNSTLLLNDVLENLLKYLMNMVEYEKSHLLLKDDDKFRVVTARGYKKEIKGIEIDVNEIIDMINETDSGSLAINNLDEVQNKALYESILFSRKTKSFIVIPLTSKNKLLGLMVIESMKINTFDDNKKSLLVGYGGQAAIAIENARLFEEVNQLATTDGLTNLFNRRYFFLLSDKEINKSKRYKHPLSAAMIDIDFFKKLNDNYGHAVGDQVLRSVSELFTEIIYSSDIIGRYGGEEFAVLMPETDIDQAILVAEKVRIAIENLSIFSEEFGEIKCTVSVGVAEWKHEMTIIELLNNADKGLYMAKEQGRNRTIKYIKEQ